MITILAALDPAGPFAAVCGITVVLLWPTSSVAAFTAAVLCPFKRTLKQAYRLSRFALWTGSICFAVTLTTIVETAGSQTDPPESISDGVIFVSLTGIAPVVAFFVLRYSRRKLASQKP